MPTCAPLWHVLLLSAGINSPLIDIASQTHGRYGMIMVWIRNLYSGYQYNDSNHSLEEGLKNLIVSIYSKLFHGLRKLPLKGIQGLESLTVRTASGRHVSGSKACMHEFAVRQGSWRA